MEPVTSVVSAIFKVLQAIAKAEREARRNRTRCQDLACRAQVMTNVLRDARTAWAAARGDGPAAAETRRIILCRLKEALDDALKFVESCGGRDGGRSGTRLWFRISAILDSRARAARFDGVDKRINNCLVELNAASGLSIEKKIGFAVAGHHNHPRKNKPKNKAVNAPKKGAAGQGGQNGGKGGGRRRGKNKGCGRRKQVDKRINNCLVELNAASGLSIEKKMDRLAVAGHHNHPRTNKPQKENKAGTAPKKGATGVGTGRAERGKGWRKEEREEQGCGRRKQGTASGVRFHQNGHRCTAHHHHSVEDPNSCSVM